MEEMNGIHKSGEKDTLGQKIMTLMLVTCYNQMNRKISKEVNSFIVNLRLDN